MHTKAEQQQQMCPPSAASTGVPHSVLFGSCFRPTADMMPLDAKMDHWLMLNRDVTTAQRALAEAVVSEHNRCAGVDTLQKIKHNLKNENKKHELAAVLAEVQQELHEQGAINSKLQAGIADSLEALGAYIRGLPTAYLQHHKAEMKLQDRPKGAILQQHAGVEMAGGFSVPPAHERPGNMGPSEYLTTLAPSLLRLQSLRQQPFAPRDGDMCMQLEPSHTAGLQKLQRLASKWKNAEHKQELGSILKQLHLEYQLKHNLCRRLWVAVASLGIWLQIYTSTSLVLRWHTSWLAGEQMDQPVDWLYTTLRSAAMPSACVNYQLWLHPTPNTPAAEGHSISTPGVQASFCLASGLRACQFMWCDAPKCHDGQVPGITKFVFGEDSRHGNQGSSSTPCASPAVKATAVTSPMHPAALVDPSTATANKSYMAAAAAYAAPSTQAPADSSARPNKKAKKNKHKKKRQQPPAQVLDATGSPVSRSSQPPKSVIVMSAPPPPAAAASPPASASLPSPTAQQQPSAKRPVQVPDSGSPKSPGRRKVGSTTTVPAAASSPAQDAHRIAAAVPDSPSAATAATTALPVARLSTPSPAKVGASSDADMASAALTVSAAAVSSYAAAAVSLSRSGSYAAAAKGGKEQATMIAPKKPSAPRRVSTEDPTASSSSSARGRSDSSWGTAGGSWGARGASDKGSFAKTPRNSPAMSNRPGRSWGYGPSEGSRGGSVQQGQDKPPMAAPTAQAAAVGWGPSSTTYQPYPDTF